MEQLNKAHEQIERAIERVILNRSIYSPEMRQKLVAARNAIEEACVQAEREGLTDGDATQNRR